MKKMRVSLTCLVLMLTGIIGCHRYQAPVAHDFQNSRVYQTSFNDVWGLIVEWYNVTGAPIWRIDAGSGFIASEEQLPAGKGDVCDCGRKGSFEYLDQAVGEVRVHARQLENGVRVTVYTSYSTLMTTTYLVGSPDYTTKIRCTSTGKLEGDILDYIAGGGET